MQLGKWWERETKEQLVDRLIAKSDTINRLCLELEVLRKRIVELESKNK